MKLKKLTKKSRLGTGERSHINLSRKIFSFKSPHENKDMSRILQNLNSPINVFDHRNKKFIYVNDKFMQLAGLTLEECYNQQLKDFSSWIHVDDLLMLENQIGKRLGEVYFEYVQDNSTQLSYLVNFRLKEKEKDREPISVLAQCSVIEWDKNHTPAVTLNILSDISHYNYNQKMILTVNLYDDHLQQWKIILREEFLIIPNMLSKREKEIMAHIVQDKSATEISQSLNMPFYTVRSHWRNILQKTRCKTQKELKHLAHVEGWV